MDDNGMPLFPFEIDLRQKAEADARKAKLKALGAHLWQVRVRSAEAAAAAKARFKRASFEFKAAAHSSATLAGLSRDFRRLTGAAARTAGAAAKTAKVESAAISGLRVDLRRAGDGVRGDFRRLANELPVELRNAKAATKAAMDKLAIRMEAAGGRTKKALLRSSTVSGLAIDGKRVVRKVKENRHKRKMRPAH